jgi:SAM-dependent methyltransferase
MALRCLKNGARILSIGAGGAFVEEVVTKRLQAKVFVVDFPAALPFLGRFYDTLFEGAFAADVMAPDWSPPVTDLDAVFWFDNIEHLAADPAILLKKLNPAVKPGGQVFLTTDNFARLRNILKLMCRRPIVAPPELLFAPVNFAHEFVHRREYTAEEIRTVFTRSGFTVVETEFLWQNRSERPSKLLFRSIELLLPRYRPHMLVRAVKNP